MARFKSTITDRGAEALTAFLAAGKRLVLVSAAAGDGVAQVSPNTLTALVNPIDVNAQIGEKTFVESNPSYMRIPVQITNAGLESAQYVREVATFALDEKDAPFMFSYSWLDGADSDNILPPDSFLGRAGMDGEGDTVHIHDVAVVVTNQENSGITVEVGNGSFVTTAQMVAYSAPIVHGHAASDVQESTGESVESVQRRQDFDISAIREQLDTGFAGTAVTHTFATAQLNQWKGSRRDSGRREEPAVSMTRFACKPPETSCLLSNLFTELRPVCGRCEGDNVVLCGLTYEGEEQTVVLRDYGFDYSGRRETVERIRKRRCINGNPEKLSAEGEWE